MSVHLACDLSSFFFFHLLIILIPIWIHRLWIRQPGTDQIYRKHTTACSMLLIGQWLFIQFYYYLFICFLLKKKNKAVNFWTKNNLDLFLASSQFFSVQNICSKIRFFLVPLYQMILWKRIKFEQNRQIYHFFTKIFLLNE